MIRGFWSARTALNAQQIKIDVIGNNLANVNTQGFKPMRASFKDLMYTNMNTPNAEDTAMAGHGVRLNSTDMLMNQGPLVNTGRAMDMALEEEGGFFMLSGDGEDIFYTRVGAFYIQLEDQDEAYLVDGNGYRVLDSEGDEIELEQDSSGKFVFDPQQVGVYRVPNAYGLAPVGNSHYIETDSSGEPEAIENPAYKVGYLEGSGTEVSVEMVNIIEASKAFSLNSRITQVADEIEQTINTLR